MVNIAFLKGEKMKIGKEHQRKIKEIMASTKCNKGFQCYKSGFSNSNKVKHFNEGLLQCLKDSTESSGCQHSLLHDDIRFCDCEVRKYVTKHVLNN